MKLGWLAQNVLTGGDLPVPYVPGGEKRIG